MILAAGFVAWAPMTRAADGPQQFLKKPDDWFGSEEAKRKADNILSHQSELGGWPKNIDTTATRFDGDRSKLAPTFDNGATTAELRYLARMVRASSDARYRDAFDKGLTYTLEAQYANGGWPQYSPPPRNTYHRHITFNDNAMTRLLEFLRDCKASDVFAFLPEDRKLAVGQAFDRGIQRERQTDRLVRPARQNRLSPAAWADVRTGQSQRIGIGGARATPDEHRTPVR
jgi:pectate lyase